MDTYVKNMMPTQVIKTGGTMTVSSGGIAAHTCVTSRGLIEVLSGGTGRDLRGASSDSSVIIRSGASLQITSGNTAQYILGQGKIDVYSGGSLRSSLLQQNVQADVSAGYVQGVTVTDAAKNGTAYVYYPSLILSNATVASKLTVGQNGHLRVRGASITSSIVSGSVAALAQEPVTQQQHDAGYIGNCSAYQGGTIYVRGLAQNITAGSGGAVNVAATAQTSFTSGILRNLTVSGGVGVVSSGGVCAGTVISSGGTLTVSSGASATQTSVKAAGVLKIAGFGSDIQVSSGGTCNISSGGACTNAAAETGGTLIVANSGQLSLSAYTGTNIVLSGATNEYAFLQLKPGAVASNVRTSGSAAVYCHAHSSAIISGITTLESTHIQLDRQNSIYNANLTNGRINVWDGYVENAVVSSGGLINVLSGGAVLGVVSSVTVVSGGSLILQTNTVNKTRAYNVVLSGGVMTISSGCAAQNVSCYSIPNNTGYIYIKEGNLYNGYIADSGIVHISSGGSFESGTVIGGGRINLSSNATVAGDVTVAAGGLIVGYGGYIGQQGDILVSGSGAKIEIVSGYGGGIQNTTAVAGGTIYARGDGVNRVITINSGGVLSAQMTVPNANIQIQDLAINSSGHAYISSGCQVHWFTVGGGWAYLDVYSGGNITDGSAYNALVRLYSGASANSVSVGANGQLAGYGGNMTNLTISGTGARAVIADGYDGAISSAVVKQGGYIDARGGGVYQHNYLTASSGGTITIYAPIQPGRYTSNIHAYTSGRITVSSGAKVSAGYVEGTQGYIFVQSGGTASGVTALSGPGRLHVSAGGTLRNCIAGSGGYVRGDGLFDRCSALNNGYLYPWDGASMYAPVVFSNGLLQLISNTIANSAVISSGGTLVVSSGGTALSVDSKNGAVVIVRQGGSYTSLNTNQ